MNKSINFDQVADLYDVYVPVNFDVAFWKEEARSCDGEILELMCGTGRIGLPLIEEGLSYTGLDYSQKLIGQFRDKLRRTSRDAELIYADARTFELSRSFDLVFIGFHSLSEVLQDQEKEAVLKRVRAHLKRTGRFTFSLHNPTARNPSLNGKKSTPQVFYFAQGQRELTFSYRFDPPSSEGMVCGKQFYTIKNRAGRILEARELDLQFHLITKSEMENLLTKTGFRVEHLWSDYDRSNYLQTSPYMIYRCVL